MATNKDDKNVTPVGQFQMNNANGANQPPEQPIGQNASGTNANQPDDEAKRLTEEAKAAEDARIAEEIAAKADAKAAEEAKKIAEAEAAKKAEEAKAAESTAEVKHSITYIGNGVWTDNTGQKWAREAHGNVINHKVFTDAELQQRKDILFMIDYKTMRQVTVE